MVQDGIMSVGVFIEFVVYIVIIGVFIVGFGNFYIELLGVIGAIECICEIFLENQEIDI